MDILITSISVLKYYIHKIIFGLGTWSLTRTHKVTKETSYETLTANVIET